MKNKQIVKNGGFLPFVAQNIKINMPPEGKYTYKVERAYFAIANTAKKRDDQNKLQYVPIDSTQYRILLHNESIPLTRGLIILREEHGKENDQFTDEVIETQEFYFRSDNNPRTTASNPYPADDWSLIYYSEHGASSIPMFQNANYANVSNLMQSETAHISLYTQRLHVEIFLCTLEQILSFAPMGPYLDVSPFLYHKFVQKHGGTSKKANSGYEFRFSDDAYLHIRENALRDITLSKTEEIKALVDNMPLLSKPETAYQNEYNTLKQIYGNGKETTVWYKSIIKTMAAEKLDHLNKLEIEVPTDNLHIRAMRNQHRAQLIGILSK